MDHYQYLFEDVSVGDKELLIAMLSDIGFDGFEECGRQLKAFTSVMIPATEINDIVKLTTASYSISLMPEQNWNEQWEKDFEPVTVMMPGSRKIFANIRANFHPPRPDPGYEIIITPKMSFGTGHHDTTYGMVECMSGIGFVGKTVVDFGTGTGVLAILAEKLGASRVTAIDNDDWSINNAAENIKINDCSKIELIKADSLVNDIQADIILANINLNVILSNVESLIKACNKNGTILLSGMLAGDKPLIHDALIKYGVHVITIYERNNWIIILANVK